MSVRALLPLLAIAAELEGDALPTLGIGSRGPLVKAWQVVVNAKPDGAFGTRETGPKTRAWQAARGLLVTGEVDAGHWRLALEDDDTRAAVCRFLSAEMPALLSP